MKCPSCGSTRMVDTVRLEECRDCGWYQWYGDVHATNPKYKISHGTDQPLNPNEFPDAKE